MNAVPASRSPLRSVSIGILFVLAAVTILLYDLLNRMHPAQSRESWVVQGLFDLCHPEVDGAFNPFGHFLDNCFNESVSRCCHGQEATNLSDLRCGADSSAILPDA